MHLALTMATMATGGCLPATVEELQDLIENPRAEGEKSGSWELSFWGIKMWRVQQMDTRLCVLKSIPTAASLVHMALRRIRRHGGGNEEWAHLHATDTDSLHLIRHHLFPVRHLRNLVTTEESRVPKPRKFHLGMCN